MKRRIISNDEVNTSENELNEYLNSYINKKYPGSKLCLSADIWEGKAFDVYLKKLPGYEYDSGNVLETRLIKVPEGRHGQIFVNVGSRMLYPGTSPDQYEFQSLMSKIDDVYELGSRLDSLYDKLEKCFDIFVSRYPDYEIEYRAGFTENGYRLRFVWTFSSNGRNFEIKLNENPLKLSIDDIIGEVSSKVDKKATTRSKNSKSMFYKELEYSDRTDVSNEKTYSYYLTNTGEQFLELTYTKYSNDYQKGNTSILFSVMENSTVSYEELFSNMGIPGPYDYEEYEYDDMTITEFDKILRKALKAIIR